MFTVAQDLSGCAACVLRLSVVNYKWKKICGCLGLFVLDACSGEKIPAVVEEATGQDLAATRDWQTSWKTPFAVGLPNKVALRRTDDGELLGLMSYELDEKGLAVEVIYMESVRHSNANLLYAEGEHKKYYGIAKALFAYAVQMSLDAGFDGILVFKAKPSELLKYYVRAFGARRAAAYDLLRMILWEDVAERIIVEFRKDFDE